MPKHNQIQKKVRCDFINSTCQKKSLFLYAVFLCLMLFALHCKSYYFTDEISSYVLSNVQIQGDHVSVRPSFNIRFSPAKVTLPMVLSVYDNSYDYKTVWVNQAKDTHPPLYYALLHTICSFFPRIFSKWFAGIINIIFAFATLFILQKLLRLFTDDNIILTTITLVFMLNSCILNSIAFLRMYIMAMFWVTLYTYLLAKQVSAAENKYDKKFCRKFFAVTLFGILTHYYCGLIFALMSTIFALYLIKDKKYEQLMHFCATQLVAVVSAYAIFPAMARHILKGVRAKEVFFNICNIHDLCYRVQRTVSFINTALFGGTFYILVLILISIYIWQHCRKKELIAATPHQSKNREYVLILLPTFVYFLLMAKTIHTFYDYYEHWRFFTLIFAVLLPVILLLVFTRLKEILDSKKAYCVIALLSVAVIIGSFINTDWNGAYLYRAYNNDAQEMYQDFDCITILMQPHFTNRSLYELSKYKSITYITTHNLNSKELNSLLKKEKLAVCILSRLPNLSIDESDRWLNIILQKSNYMYSIVRRPLFGNSVYFGPIAEVGYIYYLQQMDVPGSMPSVNRR